MPRLGSAPAYKRNDPLIAQMAKSLQQAGHGSYEQVMNKWNTAVAKGPDYVDQMMPKLEELGRIAGQEINRAAFLPGGADRLNSKPAAPSEPGLAATTRGVGKGLWNGLVSLAQGVVELPETVLGAERGLEAGVMAASQFIRGDVPRTADGFGQAFDQADAAIGQSALSLGKSDALLNRMRSVSEFINGGLDQVKFATDPKTLLSYNDGVQWTGALDEGTGAALGEGLFTAVSALAPALGAAKIGQLPKLIRAAELAGDLGEAALLTSRLRQTQTGLSTLSSTVSMVRPITEEARAAGLSPTETSLFAGLLAPVMGVMETKLGIEKNFFAGAGRPIRDSAIKAGLSELRAGVSEASLRQAARTTTNALMRYIKSAPANVLEGAFKEGVYEEGLQSASEEFAKLVFNNTIGANASTGKGQFDQSMNSVMNNIVGSMSMGAAIGGFLNTFHNSGAMTPTLYGAIDQRIRQGETPDTVQQWLSPLLDGLDSQPDLSPQARQEIRQNVTDLIDVATRFARLPNTTAHQRYQYYDITRNHLPDVSGRIMAAEAVANELPDLQAQYAQAQGDDKIDIAARIAEINAALPPGYNDSERAKDERRMRFLTNQVDGVLSGVQPIPVSEGLGHIDRLDVGMLASGKGENGPVKGSIVDISADGQQVTISQPTEDGTPNIPVTLPAKQVVVRSESDIAPPSVTVQNPRTMADEVGFVSPELKPLTTYQPGEFVRLAGIADPIRVEGITADEGQVPTITLAMPGPDGQTTPQTYDMEQLLSDADNGFLGGYDPELALQQEANARREAQTNQLRAKLESKLSPTTVSAINALSDAALMGRRESLKGKATPADERPLRDYINFIADQRGLTTPANETAQTTPNDPASASPLSAAPTAATADPDAVLENGPVAYDPEQGTVFINGMPYTLPEGQSLADAFQYDKNGKLFGVKLLDTKGTERTIRKGDVLTALQTLDLQVQMSSLPAAVVDQAIDEAIADTQADGAESATDPDALTPVGQQRMNQAVGLFDAIFAAPTIEQVISTGGEGFTAEEIGATAAVVQSVAAQLETMRPGEGLIASDAEVLGRYIDENMPGLYRVDQLLTGLYEMAQTQQNNGESTTPTGNPADNPDQPGAVAESGQGQSDPLAADGVVAVQPQPEALPPAAEPTPAGAGPALAVAGNDQPDGGSANRAATEPGASANPDGSAAPAGNPDAVAPVSDSDYRAFRQDPTGFLLTPELAQGIADRIREGRSDTRDQVIYQNRRAEIDPLIARGRGLTGSPAPLPAGLSDISLDETDATDLELASLEAGTLAQPLTGGAASVVGSVGMAVQVGRTNPFEATIVSFTEDGQVVVNRDRMGKKGKFTYPLDAIRDGRGVRSVTLPANIAEANAVAAAGPATTASASDPVAAETVEVEGIYKNYTLPGAGKKGYLVRVADLSTTPDGKVIADVFVIATKERRSILASKLMEASEAERIKGRQLVDKAIPKRLPVIREQRPPLGRPLAADPVGRFRLESFISGFRGAFPGVRAEVLANEEMTEGFGDGVVGAVREGVVYLNADYATAETPLHEFGHLYTTLIKREMRDLYQAGLNLVRGSEYDTRVREVYAGRGLTDEQLLEEALVTAIGERGMGLAKPGLLKRFTTWISVLMKRIGAKLGLTLTPETTLEAFADARAEELLAGLPLSLRSSEELGTLSDEMGMAPDRAAIHVGPLPLSIDGNWLSKFSLSKEQLKALEAYGRDVDPVTNEIVRIAPDLAGQQLDFESTQTRLSGRIYNIVRGIALSLDLRNLVRLLFGNSLTGRRFLAVVDAARDRVAPLKRVSHTALEALYKESEGITSHRHLTLTEEVPTWTVVGQVNGQTGPFEVPVDVALSMVAVYKRIMANTNGGKKEVNGIVTYVEPPAFRMVNPGNADQTVELRLSLQGLREMEARVESDAKLTGIMGIWRELTTAVAPKIQLEYQLSTGKQLALVKEYFPMRTIAEEKSLNRRQIQQFVSDAGLLKESSGIPAVVIAEPFLAGVERYVRQAENYVQFNPVYAEMDRLHQAQANGYGTGQKDYWKFKGLAGGSGPEKAWRQLMEGIGSPDEGRNSASIGISIPKLGRLDVGLRMRQATLSRFAFNVGIGLKQVTGYVSAIGNGFIDDKYLYAEAPSYASLVGNAYRLWARGSDSGDYDNTPTAFDLGMAELQAVASSGVKSAGSADVLLWRMNGTATPDTDLDTFNQYTGTTSRWQQIEAGRQRWTRKYGLAAMHRADAAVALSLYRAALRQVSDTTPQASPEEQRAEAARLAVEALYFSNQTYDRTDKSALQVDSNPFLQILALYRGQSSKVMNATVQRVLEVGYAADESARNSAVEALSKQLVVNAVINPLLVAVIDTLLQSLRYKFSDDDEKGDTTISDFLWRYVRNLIGSYTPPGAAQIVESGVDVISGVPWAESAFMETPFTPVGQLAFDIVSLIRFAPIPVIQRDDFKSRAHYLKELNKAIRSFNRSLSETAGLPSEITRQINIQIENLLPPPSPHQMPATYGSDEVLLGDAPEGGKRKSRLRRGPY